VQKDNGCWQSDTAFILHAGWPKNPIGSSGTGGGSTNCEDFGHFCVPIGECSLADKLDSFLCPSVVQDCCQARQQEPTCSEKFGVVCNLDQECSGDQVISLDSNFCCVGNCIEIEIENECESFLNHFCRIECSDSQEEKVGYTSACGTGDICCGPKPDEGSNLWLIILLVILIILVILAIIFRNQLKVFLFKRKSGAKTSKTGPPSGPGMMPLPIQNILPRPVRRGPPRRSRSPGKDKEFEDTMKKLRDMSK
jgi:hypothetical protein